MHDETYDGEFDPLETPPKYDGSLLRKPQTLQTRGSGWVLSAIENTEVTLARYEPLSGSSYIPLPKKIATKKLSLT